MSCGRLRQARSVPSVDYEFRTLQSSDSSVTITQNTDDIDLIVPASPSSADVFQEDSTATLTSSSTTFVTFVTLASDAKLLDGEEWKINMGLLVCNPVADTDNSEMSWQIETSAGVFSEIDTYSSHAGLLIVGDERSMPIERTKNVVLQMDAPRMRLQVRRVSAGSGVLFEFPRWGGVQIEDTP